MKCLTILRLAFFISITKGFSIREPITIHKPFTVYWNVPTKQCRNTRVEISEALNSFGIIHNNNDNFNGNEITILYAPGLFPAFLNDTGKEIIQNGGVPQEGDLPLHLTVFVNDLNKKIPDKKFSGKAIIDFEYWQPVYRQNFATRQIYKLLSIQIEKELHPTWNQTQIEHEAQRRFEIAAKLFLEQTLIVAKKRRPFAQWGYYAYPYCFNMNPSDMRENCKPQVQIENNSLKWLFKHSQMIMPSVYYGRQRLNSNQRIQLVRGRIREAVRMSRRVGGRHVVPYTWYKYGDDQERFVTKNDFNSTLQTIKHLGGDGAIIWGSSIDVQNSNKCDLLLKYLIEVIGPAVLSLK